VVDFLEGLLFGYALKKVVKVIAVIVGLFMAGLAYLQYQQIASGGSAYVSKKFAVEGLSESMSYELEPFGIKVVIVEPGVITTNFVDGLVIAKKSQEPNSPYSQIMQKISTGFEEMMKNASSPDLVAKVVLDAIRDENPTLRYLAGSDVEAWLGGNRKIADEELHKMMKQNLMV
jgi:NAD(P)-dependent dehydrogenase (short-subunit alcohol dehydrogenase family)